MVHYTDLFSKSLPTAKIGITRGYASIALAPLVAAVILSIFVYLKRRCKVHRVIIISKQTNVY